MSVANGGITTDKIDDGAVTTIKIANGTIVDSDISNSAAISPGKISGTAWTSTNDGSGSGLDADMLDGLDSKDLKVTSVDGLSGGTISGNITTTGNVTIQDGSNGLKLQNGSKNGSITLNSSGDITITPNLVSGIGDVIVSGDGVDFIIDNILTKQASFKNPTSGFVRGILNIDSSDNFNISTLGAGHIKIISTGVDISAGAGVNVIGNMQVNGNLVSDRHNISVGNTNAIVAKNSASTNYPVIHGESTGAATGVWGESNQAPGVYGKSSGNYGVGGETTTPDHYGMAAFGVDNNSKGLYVRGYIYATGGVRTSVATNTGNVLASAVTSPSAKFLISGSGDLNNGMASVAFDPVFVETVPSDAELRVLITPTADCNGLYLASKSRNGFVARELQGGKSNASFDWIAIVTLPIHEDKPPIAEPMSQGKASLSNP